jgi:hypothetical protein
VKRFTAKESNRLYILSNRWIPGGNRTGDTDHRDDPGYPLGRLVALGTLTRRAYQDNPPRDEYLLTDAGLGLYPIYLSMLDWGDRWLADGSDATTVLEHNGCQEHHVVDRLPAPGHDLAELAVLHRA